MTDTPETDAEVVEQLRKATQTATDAAFDAHGAGKTFEQFSEDYGKSTELRRVVAPDLRLIGTFILDMSKAPRALPAPILMRTQWVFQHRQEDAYYVVGFQNVMILDRFGFAELKAFVDAGDAC